MSDYHTPKQPTEYELRYMRLNYRYSDGNLVNMYGRRLGTIKNDGYRYVSIRSGRKDKFFSVHHIVWYLCKCEWPKTQINHINELKHDNHIENLEEITQRDNIIAHYEANKNNGLPVCVYRKRRGFQAQIWVNGRSKYLGAYRTPQMAFLRYRLEYEKIHGHPPKVNYLPSRYNEYENAT